MYNVQFTIKEGTMNSDIIKMTATELAAKIKSKELSSVEVTKAFLGRIKEVDPKIKAYVSVCEDYALSRHNNPMIK